MKLYSKTGKTEKNYYYLWTLLSPFILEQTARYKNLLCCNAGWMVVFDRRPTAGWEDKLYMSKETMNGKTIYDRLGVITSLHGSSDAGADFRIRTLSVPFDRSAN
jgi:hypothetical protein